MTPPVVGALLNSALFLAGCFVAGLVLHDAVAWKFSLMSVACCYYAYNFASIEWTRATAGAVGASIVTGAIAGFSLLFAG